MIYDRSEKWPGVHIYEPVWVRPKKKTEDFGILSASPLTRSFPVPAPPPPPPPVPPTTKILVIGTPYYSLGIPDPTAVVSGDTSWDRYGVQTVIYSPNVATSGPAVPGFIVKGGGWVTRQEVAGSDLTDSYVDVRVYDFDGNFLRKNSYLGFRDYVWLYTYEANRQSLRLSDDKILSYLDYSNFNCNFGICDIDGMNASTLAFYSNLEIVYDMSLNVISNSVYISPDAQYNMPPELYKLSSSLSPEWAYAYTALGDVGTLYAPYTSSIDVSGVETTFIGGRLVKNSEPAINQRRRLALISVDETGTVINAWYYANTSPWLTGVSYDSPLYFNICSLAKKPLNGSLLVTGQSACPPVDPGGLNETYSAYIASFNPSTGDVISAKVIGFTFEGYGGIRNTLNNTIIVDEEGYIYVAFTPYFGSEAFDPAYSYGLCVVCKFDSSLNFLGALSITPEQRGGLVSGALELAGDKLLVPLMMDYGTWAGPDTPDPYDGAAVILDKVSFDNNSAVGEYWKEGVPGGPGFYIRRLTTADVEMVDLTLTKTDFTVTRDARFFASGTPTIETSIKDPADVVLTKVVLP